MSIKLQRIIAHIAVEVYGFKSFAKLLRLGYVFFKKESFESFIKRSWTRNFDHCGPRLDFFFLPRFRSTKQAAEAFFLAYRLIKSGWPWVIHSFNHNSYSFLQSNQTIQAFLRNYFEELWTPQVLSVDYSFRYFLSHSISSANQVVMQIGELTIRGYFGPCSHVTETQGFFQQKKNTERQAKMSKKVKLHANKSVSSR